MIPSALAPFSTTLSLTSSALLGSSSPSAASQPSWHPHYRQPFPREKDACLKVFTSANCFWCRCALVVRNVANKCPLAMASADDINRAEGEGHLVLEGRDVGSWSDELCYSWRQSDDVMTRHGSQSNLVLYQISSLFRFSTSMYISLVVYERS